MERRRKIMQEQREKTGIETDSFMDNSLGIFCICGFQTCAKSYYSAGAKKTETTIK